MEHHPYPVAGGTGPGDFEDGFRVVPAGVFLVIGPEVAVMVGQAVVHRFYGFAVFFHFLPVSAGRFGEDAGEHAVGEAFGEDHLVGWVVVRGVLAGEFEVVDDLVVDVSDRTSWGIVLVVDFFNVFCGDGWWDGVHQWDVAP